MRSVVSTFTRAVATLAVVALPVAGFAQSQASAQPNPAAEHLAAARSALNKVLNAPAPTGDAFKLLSDLKTEYIALERAASTAAPEWATRYATVDRIVGQLIGAPAASGEPGAVGTSGSDSAVKVDAGIAANLQTFRTELKAFSVAMAPASAASAPAASASPASAAPAAAPTGTSGSVVAGTAPKATPLAAPAAPASAGSSATSAPASSAPSAAAAAPPSSSGDAGVAAQIDPVIALIDAALAANPVDAGGKMTVDRATLDAIKAQLQVIKAKKP